MWTWICLGSLASADRGGEGGGLCPPPGRQASVLPATDDQVVEDSNVEKRQCLLQAFGDLPVSFARLRVPARVVVEEDDGIIVFQRELARRLNLPEEPG